MSYVKKTFQSGTLNFDLNFNIYVYGLTYTLDEKQSQLFEHERFP